LALTRDGSELVVLAATGVASAAAPAIVAPLRKLRRPVSGELLRLGISISRNFMSDAETAPFFVGQVSRRPYVASSALARGGALRSTA
jgi:hypothetical protein